MSDLEQKMANLRQSLDGLGRVIVAFSAGVDSTFLLKVALDRLGADNVLAATGVSPSLAQKELQSVRDLAGLLGANLELIVTSEMDNPAYVQNDPRRCFHCKSELYTKLQELARGRGFDAICNGANADDRGDYRPGMEAARDYRVRSPLLEAQLTKADIRQAAKQLNLPNWDKPALACLASRLPYGTPVTPLSLDQIQRAENILAEMGFSPLRVRHHGKLARIEVSVEQLPQLLPQSVRQEIVRQFKQIGYTYITVDLQGFRSGSGNEVLAAAAFTAVK